VVLASEAGEHRLPGEVDLRGLGIVVGLGGVKGPEVRPGGVVADDERFALRETGVLALLDRLEGDRARR
jgi:hypothetical protein